MQYVRLSCFPLVPFTPFDHDSGPELVCAGFPAFLLYACDVFFSVCKWHIEDKSSFAGYAIRFGGGVHGAYLGWGHVTRQK